MKQRSRVLFAGLALIITTNAIALLGVAYNRSGEPDAVVELTERELTLPYDYGFKKENSGIVLRLDWRVDHAAPYSPNYYDRWGIVPWLTKEKLGELGFDVSQPLTSQDARWRYQKTLPREVYLVLEYNGDEYQKALEKRNAELAAEQALLADNPEKEEFKKRTKAAQERLEAEERHNSRLFVIDAGIDKDVLRTRYADRSKHIIMAGQVDMQVLDKNRVYSLQGYIRGVNIGAVNVPHNHHSILDPLMIPDSYQRKKEGPRYVVRLGYGKRLEPWVIGLRPTK